MYNISESGAKLDNMSPKDIIFSVLGGLADLGNIVGNIIIVLIIYGENKFRSVASRLLVNQAFADGCVGLLYIIGIIHIILFDPNLHDERITLTFVRVCLVVLYSESLQTLGATAFSLYVAICHPVKFRIHKRNWIVTVFIVVTWTINVAVGCLVFVADDAFMNDDLMLFSFYRHKPEDIWYEVLKMVVMFLAPLLGVVCFIKVVIYKRAMRRGDVQAQSNTNKLVSQSLGVLLMSTVYILAFLVQIVGENVFPITKDNPNMMPILSFFVYLYLVLKLPLLLLIFKPYRKVARQLCCCLAENRVHPPPNLTTDSGSTNTIADFTDMEMRRKGKTISKLDPAKLHQTWIPASIAGGSGYRHSRQDVRPKETTL